MSERSISKRQDKVENEKDACVPGFCKHDFGQLSLDDLPLRLVNLCPQVSAVLADSFPQFDSGKLSDLMKERKGRKPIRRMKRLLIYATTRSGMLEDGTYGLLRRLGDDLSESRDT